MLREASLDTKHRELRTCVGARKRKLSELYNVAATVAAKPTRGPPPKSTAAPPDAPPFSEARFRDENDIAQGKYFHISLLDRLPGAALRLVNAGAVSRFPSKRARPEDGPPNAASRGYDSSSSREEAILDNSLKEAKVLSNTADKTASSDATHALDHPQPALRDAGREDRGVSASDTSAQQDRIGVGTPTLKSDQESNHHDPERPLHMRSEDARPNDRKTVKGERFPDLDIADASQEDRTGATSAPDVQLVTDAPKRSGVSHQDNQRSLKEESPDLNRSGTIASRRQNSLGPDQDATNAISSQKAPIRIDTGVSRNRSSNDFASSMNALTPLRSAQSAMQSSPPERMTTRVSSGALRHKSVSEILGETPKSSPIQSAQDTPRDEYGQAFRRTSIVASPDSAVPGSRLSDIKDREKERSKLSAVVFARQKGPEASRSGEVNSALQKEKSEEEKDYLVPLFAAQASAQTPTLSHLISTAHKTLTTANHYVEYHESQDCRILKRIYHLQNSNRWSLRQLERAAEPARQTTQWDALLGEVKWMRTDFREERKWKVIAARNLALWCANWVATPKDLRPSLQVKARVSGATSSSKPDGQEPSSAPNAAGIDREKTPELMDSFEGDISEPSEDDLHPDVLKVPAPATLFSLGPDHITFGLDKTPMSDKLLAELPQYQPYFNSQDTELGLGELIDSAWRQPIVPVSKHAIGKIVIREEGSRQKKSRYDYSPEDDIEDDTTIHSSSSKAVVPLPPEQDDVALFNPRNKHIIARLHATHAFRPPSQHPMPSQQFFECRYPSQWTVAEDDELRRLVREYEYNWHLISECLSSKSLFSSGAERRTPWECFERWESFEGLPGDMDKHSYFRAWRLRRQSAKLQLEQRFMHQQQSGSNAQVMRRRSSEPMHVEKRRNDKHYALLSAVSKVVKRRETLLQKQQHAAQLAAFRRQPESTQPRLRMQTPQEFSAHKHKQEVEFKEKQLLYRQQMEQNRRAALEQQRAAQQAGRHQSGLSVPPQNRMALAASINAANQRAGASMGQAGAQNSGRPFSSSQNMPNSAGPNSPGIPVNRQQASMGVAGASVPQAQMQGYIQGQHGGMGVQPSQDASRVMNEAIRLQEQQRLMQRQVRNQPNGYSASQQSAHNPSVSNMQHGNKLSSANGIAGSQQHSSVSPSGPNPAQAAQQLSSGMVPLLNQITNQLKASHPHATSEQIKQMATQNLNMHLRNQNAQASNGSSGNVANGSSQAQQQQQQQQQSGLGSNGSTMNPHMYAQYMRSQQANQQSRHVMNGNSPNMTNGGDGTRPASRDTPGSQGRGSGATNGTGSSPRPHQAQTAGPPS